MVENKYFVTDISDGFFLLRVVNIIKNSGFV